MIYTVTCNPALDYTVTLPQLAVGKLNRTAGGMLTPGGKGINVSRVLTALGQENVALGFAAGETGRLLEGMLAAQGVSTAFLRLTEGNTRINVKLYADTETELNAPGAAVDKASFAALLAKLEELTAGEVLCLCGSPAPGLPADAYARLLTAAERRGAYTVLDASGKPFAEALVARPWLVKPNREELSDLLGQAIRTIEQAADGAVKLQAMGARNVLVSLGGEGALLCTERGRRLYLPAPDGEVKGTVGAGDSAVAGFVTGWVATGSLEQALRTAVAAGSATAFAGTLTNGDGVRRVLERTGEPKEI